MNTQENNKTIAQVIKTQQNNKMIAEFMKHSHPFLPSKSTINYTAEDLDYDNDWNWLMPVVEKIENLGYEFFIVENRVEVAHNTDHSIETIIDLTFNGGKKGATYQGVVEFINQYNKDESID